MRLTYIIFSFSQTPSTAQVCWREWNWARHPAHHRRRTWTITLGQRIMPEVTSQHFNDLSSPETKNCRTAAERREMKEERKSAMRTTCTEDTSCRAPSPVMTVKEIRTSNQTAREAQATSNRQTKSTSPPFPILTIPDPTSSVWVSRVWNSLCRQSDERCPREQSPSRIHPTSGAVEEISRRWTRDYPRNFPPSLSLDALTLLQSPGLSGMTPPC